MKMKPFRALAVCMALALAAQVSASSTPSAQHSAPPGPPAGSAAEAVVLPTATLDADLTTLSPNELEAVEGTGAGTDLACGAMAGAGLAATLSGAGAPIGVPLALAGFACALFF